MPSIIGHSAMALFIQQTRHKKNSVKIILLSLLCGFFPDFDVIGLAHNVPYESLFGHRGFSHSFFFAFILAFFVTFGFFPKLKIRSREFSKLFLTFFLITISHPILDAMTNGGYGIAFLAPFSDTRFFLPFRPIPVSMLGVNNMLSERSIHAFCFEFFFMLIPSLLYAYFLHIYRKNKNPK